MTTAIIQSQSPSGNWREVGRCSADPAIMAKRLDDTARRYNQRVRAIDSGGRVLDIR